MGFDTLRVVQVLWALGDVLLTGGAFAVLGVYGSDADKNCRYGGLFLWTLCGIAPAVLYILGDLHTSYQAESHVRACQICCMVGRSGRQHSWVGGVAAEGVAYPTSLTAPLAPS